MIDLDFLFFSPIGWDNMEGAHRPVRIASELARRGHGVIYIQLEKSAVKPRGGNLRVYDLEELGLGESRVLAGYYGLDYGNMDASRAALEGILGEWENRKADKVAIFSAPFRPFLEFMPLLRTRGYRIVFDVLDDYAEMRAVGYYCYDAAAEKFLAQACDLALPLSPDLEAKMHSYGAPRVCLLKDGVDLDVFGAANAAAVSVKRGEITLGFWGWIWQYNVDVPLLIRLARARPDWQIHLIGPFDDPVASSLKSPNIHLHGKVPRRQLRAYADQFDACILPAPDDAFNRARDPLKVYEYLACGKAVIATNQPQLAGVPGVYISHDDKEFVANVERAAREPLDQARLSEFLSEQTWAKRVDTLLQVLETSPLRSPPAGSAPHGAMPGAEHDLERWQAYARHLERLVADREAHIDEMTRALAQSGLLGRIKRLLER